jgi:DNA mismatch repair protein MutL
MERPKLNRLSSEVVNQIAAGEVIERPASVVKELVDNSIDAKAHKITIKIQNGGIALIEVSDDGVGIPKENLNEIFDAHTTSKLRSIEDLNTLISMGFRGEALSTVSSVAKVTVVSKYEGDDVGYEISINEGGKSEVKKSARESGTVVRVEDLFYNIPARRKYLKSEQTEYRKIYEVLSRYFLVYPNIHFVVEKDGKTVIDLKEIKDAKPGSILYERVKDIFPEETGLSIFYDGNGMNINGFTAHPSLHTSKIVKQQIYINNRPITDHGIVRAVYEGYSRYLPFGEKIPFVINISIRPELVDVNVHPRKEEVRFENAFRVYTAVQEAVRHTLEKSLSYQDTPSQPSFEQMRETFSNNKTYDHPNYSNTEIRFDKGATSVRDSLIFSKQILNETPQAVEIVEKRDNIRNIFQIFNKYIVIEFTDDNLWVIDQHAAAERINFEKISKREKQSNMQNLLVPQVLTFSKEEILFLDEFKDFFESMGFKYIVKGDTIEITSTPVEFTIDIEKMFREIFELAENPEVLKQKFDKVKTDVLATIACHTSVRKGQKLDYSEMRSIYEELLNCENPYSCPHGRPAIWKLKLSEIDKNFERTY